MYIAESGYYKEDECKALERYAGMVREPNIIVEIGVHKGLSLSYLLSGSNVKVCGVDTWDLDKRYKNYAIAQPCSMVHDRLELIRGYGQEVGNLWHEDNVGLLHIDALHSKKCTLDIYNAWRHVLAGDCLVCFHDTHLPGVRGAIKSILHELTLVENVNRLGIYRKEQ
jgi:hypothetical protein